LRRTSIFPLIIAFLGAGLGTLVASIFLETFLFRQLVEARPDLSTWNRELNAVSLILASLIGGVVGTKLAQSSAPLSEALPARLREMLTGFKQERSPLMVLFTAGGVAVLLWLLQRLVAANPLTVGWRGILMNAAAAAAGASLLIKGGTRRVAWPALLIALGLGFSTVNYNYHKFPVAILSERVLLHGEMMVPGRHAGITYPAVLLVHDWGCQDRDETWGVNGTFREIAGHLVNHGYAVLRYDKRGCAQTSGEFIRFGLEDFARDAAVAGAFLTRRKEVEGQPIFAVGHGYGGQAITIAAHAHPSLFAGLALLATPASPVADLLKAQTSYALTALNASPEMRATRLAALDHWLEGVSSRRYLNYGDYFGTRGISEELQAEQRLTPLPPVWLRQAMAHDQPTLLASLSLPILILAGKADWRVPPSEGELMVDALIEAGHSDWQLIQLPGINHQLVVVDGMKASFLLAQTDAYAKTKHPVAPQVLEALMDWLRPLASRPAGQKE
jgi:pimeloyl-ACP methyl ester carboxylesterase